MVNCDIMIRKLERDEELKRVLVIEDLASLNAISGAAAITLLNAMQLHPALLPSVILSTQSEGYGTPITLSTDEYCHRTLSHWQKLSVKFDGLLVGYSPSQYLEWLPGELARLNLSTCLIDPVLGDDGQLYPTFDANVIKKMRQLLPLATVITPNWTELGFLVGENWKDEPSQVTLVHSAQKLLMENPNLAIVLTGVHVNSEIGVLLVSNQQIEFFGSPPVTGHFYGTGDVFSALLLGYLVQKLPLSKAVKAAQMGVTVAVNASVNLSSQERLDGLNLQPLLGKIIKGDLAFEK